MNIFKKFNSDGKCGICGTNKKGKSILVPLDDTKDGNNEKALQYHLDCVLELEFRSHAMDEGSVMLYSEQVILKK